MAWSLIQDRAGPQILTFALVFAVFQVSICNTDNCYTLKTPGITYPKGDIIIEHGSPLEIYCKLHDNFLEEHANISSKNISFIKDSKDVRPEFVQSVNRSTAKLYIEAPPPSSSMYTCVLKENSSAICLNRVIVGTKPSNVNNFSCIGYNYENLTCSWIAPKHYVTTTYNLTYYFPGRSNRVLFVCPKMKTADNVVSCYWDISTQPHYRQAQATYFFRLLMNNSFGDYVQEFKFAHFAHVIPAPPQNLRVVNKTTNSVTLSWSIKAPMNNFPPGLTYKVVYQSEYDNKDVWHVANTTSIDKNYVPIFNITDLKYSHVLYDIRVSMRSSKAQDSDTQMWSKNVSVTVRTEKTVPDAPPRINIGSFEIVNNRTGRDIYVYWQSIPEHMKNGENFSYKILSVEENCTEKKIDPLEVTNTYARFVGVNLKSHTFKIVSMNEVGHSVNSSTVFVPSFMDRVLEPISFTKISFGEQVYELSWIPPKAPKVPITNYTIFYCRNDYDRPFQCKGYLEWIEVPHNVTLKNITVPEDKTYQFAISANTENSSSGMVWASCTVIHNKGFTKMKSLWIDSIGSDFIEVGWKLDCSDRIGSIEGFIIYYCPIVSPVDITCNENEKNVTISGEPVASRGRIVNLRPYTTYMLTVSVRFKHNNGLPSDPLYNTTLEAAPEPPQHVTITNITSSSIVVKWSPPKAMNGVLRFYEVRYVLNGREHRFKPKDEKATILELTNLTSFTEYNIAVYAWTGYCSKPSEIKRVTTAISVPGQMHSPIVKFQNETVILVGWSPPTNPGGHLDNYELSIKEKINSENHTRRINTSELQWEVLNCGTDKNDKILYFSIRAINFDETLNKLYVGEWSSETEFYCQPSSKFSFYLIYIVLGILFVGGIFVLIKKLWYHCKRMRDVEVKLPPGLAPPINTDLTLATWPETIQKSSKDDTLMHSRTDLSADEELLLAKKGECGESHDRIASGDSSGCSSGHASVTSSLASGTNLSSTSDSGTEQPRTPSSESASRENSLRQRRTGSDTLGWDSEIAWPNTKGGYVLTMPVSDKPALSPQSWTTKALPATNYCVLGMDNKALPTDTGNHNGYVPVPISIPHSEPPNTTKNPSYISCDSIFSKAPETPAVQSPSPAYVKTSDAVLMGRPLAQLQHPAGGKVKSAEPPTDVTAVTSPTYVMAGGPGIGVGKGRPHAKPTGPDILPTGKLINIGPLAPVEVDNYMQHTADKDIPAVNTDTIGLKGVGQVSERDVSTSPYVKTDDIFGLKEPSIPAEYSEECDSIEQHPAQAQSPPLNSYCRLGWDKSTTGVEPPTVGAPVMRKAAEPAKGYVPHRQFENKSLKED